MYRLKPHLPVTVPKNQRRGLVLSGAYLRRQARNWHREHPEFALDMLRSMGRCRDDAETRLVERWHEEALEIGFWSKKDIVQYPLACLHAGGSLITLRSICAYLDRFTEADRDIMQQLIDVTPIHYWTYMRNKVFQDGGAG